MGNQSSVNVHSEKIPVMVLGIVKKSSMLLKNSSLSTITMMIKPSILKIILMKNISNLSCYNVIIMTITLLLNVKSTNVSLNVKMLGEMNIVLIWEILNVIAHGLNDQIDLII